MEETRKRKMISEDAERCLPLTLSVLKNRPDAIAPVRATVGAAGYDLAVPEPTVLPPRTEDGPSITKVDLGFSLGIPEGAFGKIESRSSLAYGRGITVEAGVIDSDYTGPVAVVVYNHTASSVVFAAGQRVAQLIVHPVLYPEVATVDALPSQVRGSGGFGSTGL
ncbi:deoxyuridine triphosphatase [Acanthamoeba castellanii medusavirus]|uniref:dUTP diphosphatase n=1 Tax=Acanthamoeba castellanii medusavirus J1 TaxID=3114988 RepID=A0A3T1CXD2_9VIRU|nr:deoxyuridine triphosphatase [Acanthamoeba castellanii medusavirus]BBI30488.1 deoxyuridine triphosphatase [Acanthamoeba castellanii medusavirus J1]